MKIVADLHTHTISSGHAYSTISEMARSAFDKGHQGIGITDHGPAMPNGCHQYYFSNMITLPKELHGVRLYRGCEANIIDPDGNLDIEPEIQPYLDYMIASMHIGGVSPQGLSLSETTAIWIKVMQNPLVKILGHPDNPYFPINTEEFVAEATRLNKVIELNSASLLVRKGSEPYINKIAREAKKQGTLLAVTSDAHFFDRVGDFDTILNLLTQHNIDDSQVINTSLDKIERYLHIA